MLKVINNYDTVDNGSSNLGSVGYKKSSPLGMSTSSRLDMTSSLARSSHFNNNLNNSYKSFDYFNDNTSLSNHHTRDLKLSPKSYKTDSTNYDNFSSSKQTSSSYNTKNYNNTNKMNSLGVKSSAYDENSSDINEPYHYRSQNRDVPYSNERLARSSNTNMNDYTYKKPSQEDSYRYDKYGLHDSVKTREDPSRDITKDYPTKNYNIETYNNNTNITVQSNSNSKPGNKINKNYLLKMKKKHKYKISSNISGTKFEIGKNFFMLYLGTHTKRS